MSLPMVKLEVERCICPFHGQAFKPSWPAGYPLFVARGFERLAGCRGFLQDAEALGGTPEAIQAVLTRHPICCWLARGGELEGVLDYVQHQLGLWQRGRCGRCGRLGVGCPVTYSTPAHPLPVRVPHLCFGCYVGADTVSGAGASLN
jgi:hypothetical protein